MIEFMYFHTGMNFLAHAFLAGSNPGLIVGNMLADSVNKKQYQQLPYDIRAGIDHHRQIDVFTDTHPLVRSSRELFFPHIRHYAAVIIDVIFDHYLAKNWYKYHSQPLDDFETSLYRLLDQYSLYFSEKYSFMYSRMKAHRWLYNYQFNTYIEQTICNLKHRSAEFKEADITLLVFRNNYSLLERNFFAFFDALCKVYKKE
ncbi:MAG: ACP phosphodiesterase [Flavobacteriales bacterium]|nr:ACP phosphodiesterase [Flavobacteriales bacterium]